MGEHRELHAIWSILVNKKKGYSNHPETLRWKGKLAALYARHSKLANELLDRGYTHKSKLDGRFAKGIRIQNDFVDSKASQIQILKRKKCGCKII